MFKILKGIMIEKREKIFKFKLKGEKKNRIKGSIV